LIRSINAAEPKKGQGGVGGVGEQVTPWASQKKWGGEVGPTKYYDYSSEKYVFYKCVDIPSKFLIFWLPGVGRDSSSFVVVSTFFFLPLVFGNFF